MLLTPELVCLLWYMKTNIKKQQVICCDSAVSYHKHPSGVAVSKCSRIAHTALLQKNTSLADV